MEAGKFLVIFGGGGGVGLGVVINRTSFGFR